MNQFTVGQELSRAASCNSDCIFEGTILKRTAKTVTVKSMGETKRCKIHADSEGNEYIFPYGQYSMAPTFRA